MEIIGEEGSGRSSSAGEKKSTSFKLFGAIINVSEKQDEEKVSEDCRTSWRMVTSEKNSSIDSISCNASKGKEEAVNESSSSDEDYESAKCTGYSNLFRKKRGESWSEEEHKAFLAGLQKLGRGNWKRISTEFVPTRTGTQVASHAQKYFMRMEGRGKAKRRSSIFDTQFESLSSSPNAVGMRDLVPYQDRPPTSRVDDMLKDHAQSVCSSYSDGRSGSQFPSRASWPRPQVWPNIPAPYMMGVGLQGSNEQGLTGRAGGRICFVPQLHMWNFVQASNPINPVPGPSPGQQHQPIQID